MAIKKYCEEPMENIEDERAVGNGLTRTGGRWSFDNDVPEVFVQHIWQSVPLYEEGHAITCALSDYFCPDGSLCYELGTSTGELLGKLADHNRNKCGMRWVGIDVVPEMIAKARRHCGCKPGVELICEDITKYPLEPCDMIVSYYTLQFIREWARADVVRCCYEALRRGGAMVVFEKVRAPNARIQDYMVALYNDFKIRNGFTVEEVFNKAKSLRGVLEPLSSEQNIDMFKAAGFRIVTTITKFICFEGFLAIK
jgi:tRNA (cmo5U34)-methyltransferase